MTEITITTKSDTTESEAGSFEDSPEQALATDLELVTLLRNNPDIFIRHPELLAIMQVPHPSGVATSLIERQVEVLRQKLRDSDRRLRDLMSIARENERLSDARHKLANSLFAAQDSDEVIGMVLDMLRDELSADYAVIRLFSDDASADSRYIQRNDPSLAHFKTVLEQRSVICGKPSDDQKMVLFAEDAAQIQSAAVIPLAAGSNIGLIGLGSLKAARFTASMGTDFLTQVGELVSTALARHAG